MNKKGIQAKTFVLILIIIILIAAIYFTFFFNYNCNSLSCFQAHQKNCDKTKFVNDNEDATWQYLIKGKSGNDCKIEITLLSIKKGSIDLSKLEGKTMDCYTPFGSIISPESDISKCHGILKEGLQETIINKLHAYIIENVGNIGEELKKII